MNVVRGFDKRLEPTRRMMKESLLLLHPPRGSAAVR